MDNSKDKGFVLFQYKTRYKILNSRAIRRGSLHRKIDTTITLLARPIIRLIFDHKRDRSNRLPDDRKDRSSSEIREDPSRGGFQIASRRGLEKLARGLDVSSPTS